MRAGDAERRLLRPERGGGIAARRLFRQHADASGQRQAWRARAVTAVAGLPAVWRRCRRRRSSPTRTAMTSSPAAVGLRRQVRAAVAAMREARERRLRDEQRAVEGRIRTLDRQLDVRERERSQAVQSRTAGSFQLLCRIRSPNAGSWSGVACVIGTGCWSSGCAMNNSTGSASVAYARGSGGEHRRLD